MVVVEYMSSAGQHGYEVSSTWFLHSFLPYLCRGPGGRIFSTIKENQMEKKMDNEKETREYVGIFGAIQGIIIGI